jgi:hypothetical protein
MELQRTVQILTTVYNWLILVFGEALGKILPSSAPVISSSPFRRRVRAVVAGEQSPHGHTLRV